MKNIIRKRDKNSEIIKYGIAIILLLIGIFSSIENAIPLFIIAGLIITIRSGVEIDKQNLRIKNYTSFVGLRIGKWFSYKEYKVVTNRKVKKSSRRYGGRGPSYITLKDFYYDIYLSSKDFRKKVQILSTKDKDSSIQFANDLSEKLDLPLVKYTPIPSQKTQNRRRR